MKEVIRNSSDFLFVHEAIQCNPNGDPDQENKPRMDYDTSTNLVTDTRLKRFIRDYLKDKGFEIFVDFVEDRNVNMEQRIEGVVKEIMQNNVIEVFETINDPDLLEFSKSLIDTVKEKSNATDSDFFAILWEVLTTTTTEEKKKLKKDKYLGQFESRMKEIKKINNHLLSYIVKNKFIDIRLFGSAFAIAGFTNPYTGPVQINWAYSFNKVELIDSNTGVTIMSDGAPTFCKDYRVHYSLLGYNGTINANGAKTTGLTQVDINVFRDAIWEAIPANPTRSKLNQYPKLYLEIVYNEGVSNGQFGDLRNYVSVTPKSGIAEKQVRKFSDLEINIDGLLELIAENKGEGKKIKEVIIRTSPDLKISQP